MKRGIMAAGLALMAAMVAGCFPITVSVAPDGRIAMVREEGVVVYDLKNNTGTVVVNSDEGPKAQWVMFSKDGKQLLYATGTGDGQGVTHLSVCNSDGTAAKKLYNSPGQMAYALWSPDGKYVTAGEVESQAKEGLPNMVDLKLINVATGEAKTLSGGTTPMHAWTPDSTGVVVFVAEAKAGEDGVQGKVVKIALDETKTELATAIVTDKMSIDCSHDGKEVLFTAAAMGEPEKKLDIPKKVQDQALYSYSFADKKAKLIAQAPVANAVFSPDDAHIMMGRGDKELVVTDRTGKDPKTLAKDAMSATESMDSARVLPVWMSNDTVIYWREKVVIGESGKAITTMTAKIDGSAKSNLQTKLDALLEGK